ncbi:histidine kinase [Galbibacter orientalis DSM 19592]|uniref:histidine kinase n=1 Tax=Galbibacter orientalis DSM 19592 TaxID=926559 RepID=I3C2Y5_9FLAO|nr:HAMP domain-containing sensor histidine kinase [Galbibacter orientalis]EIJ37978.1 histidine kinase [Galbibacter orientalis DSM 19592]
MKQRNKIKLLVFFCLLALAGLVSIQYYLIQNTYQLTSKTYINDVKKQIAPVIESAEIDTIEEQFFEDFKKLCFQKVYDSITSNQFQASAHILADSIQKISHIYLQSHFKNYPILKEISIRIQLTQIIFEANGVYDTVLKTNDNPLVYFGEDFKGKSFNISKGIAQSSIDQKKDSINEAIKYSYKHLQSVDMDISNFQQKIWNKMLWMLVAGVALIVAVVLLFFYMYRSLIKQKKIAEMKTDFANNISHELKTPLTSLNLITKSLQKEEAFQNSESAKKLILTLARQNTRIQTIVDRVMETSLEPQKLELQEIDIVKFLKDVTSHFDSNTHSLKSNISPNRLILKTAIDQLESVLQNLLENAIKYSPDATEIILKSYVKDHFYYIEITDFGNGIPSSEQKNIFKKFYRISEGNKHDIKGLGLGLYLCNQIMKNLKGTINVKSVPKKGSTFILKIPT